MVSSIQLRDDLLSMLVTGHETTGSVLTWTAYLLSKPILYFLRIGLMFIQEVLKLGNSTRINERCLELQKNIKDDVSKMKVTRKLAALKGLDARLQEICSYLDRGIDGKLPLNHEILCHLQQKWKDLKEHEINKTDDEQRLFYVMAAMVEVEIQSDKTEVFKNVIKEWCVTSERIAQAIAACDWLKRVKNMELEQQLNEIKDFVTVAEQRHAYDKIR
ncbi:hypothetical protein LOK49_Contig3G00008 [Camellia lanceoleosa]|nr:hypothetical protein LOK49_Contig3G00008 [Camellia lanceoleosa]